MNYNLHIEKLETDGITSFQCIGNSMIPIILSHSICTFKKFENYEVGDIVFCKVKGRYIQAHIIKAKNENRYLIGNNRGGINGWTSTIYGKVIEVKKNE